MVDYNNLVPVGADFRTLMERLRRENTGEIKTTSYPQNVPFILENLFDAAKEKVVILTWGLNDGAYTVPSVVDAAVRFMTNNPAAALEILSEKEINFHSSLMKALSAHGFQDRVTLWEVPGNVQERYGENLAIADGSHYLRIFSRARSGGVVQFGKTGISERVQHFCDRICNRSEPLPWSFALPPLISVSHLVNDSIRKRFPKSAFLPKNTPR